MARSHSGLRPRDIQPHRYFNFEIELLINIRIIISGNTLRTSMTRADWPSHWRLQKRRRRGNHEDPNELGKMVSAFLKNRDKK